MITFELNEKEFKRYKAFYNKKKKEWQKKDSSRQLSFTFSFTPTGIGDTSIVRCNADDEEKNITDFDSW